MRVVIFSGTTEGRQLACALAAEHRAVTVCVATGYGREEQPYLPDITVHTGRLDCDGMSEILRGAVLCVDATHPYAAEATKNIKKAAALKKVPYRRLLRAPSELPQNSIVLPDANAAAAWLAQRQGNVLLATGAKELSAFSALEANRIYPRILPVGSSLAACEAAGVPHRNIIAMQGPFSRELNLALLHQFEIRYLVTKDGGTVGGFAEKAEAAAAAGCTLIVLRRPEDSGETMTQILADCREMTI